MDAEDTDNSAFLGTTEQGRKFRSFKRAAESDLLVYITSTLVAMDGAGSRPRRGLGVTAHCVITTTCTRSALAS